MRPVLSEAEGITEIKRHLDGRVERFGCRLVARWPHLVVLCFGHAQKRRAGEVLLPRGSRSYGFFWRRRPYLLYRMVEPDGRVIAHRFDVVERVRLGGGEVSYRDLLLDVWVDAGGRVWVEDEEEVAEHARRGLLSAAQRARIERTRALLLRRHGAIAREAARLLSQVEGL
ncbi:MAG: hypothetical protein A2148_07150 [Chloroflexi bacterium RBG_16_68_14]|nr:MAG: hypothetical protein A2148_07150 [Chloroflexi bacterium RBG_16_68_14]